MIIPHKLKKGSHIRVIAPARSLAIISEDTRRAAIKRFNTHDFRISFSKHAEDMDIFASSSIESRVEDLHAAFADNAVDAILTSIGGFSCNELLRWL